MKFATDFYKNANQKDLPCTITIEEVSASGVPLRKRHVWKSQEKGNENVNIAQTENEPTDEKDKRGFGPQAIRSFMITYQQSTPSQSEKVQAIA